MVNRRNGQGRHGEEICLDRQLPYRRHAPAGKGGPPAVPVSFRGRTVTKIVSRTDTPSASVAATVTVAVPHFPRAYVRVSVASERSGLTRPALVLPSIDRCSPSSG